MKQTARVLTNFEDGFLNGKQYLLMECDTKSCALFCEILCRDRIESVQLLPRSRNLNGHLQRCYRSPKSECLDSLIFFGETPLRHAVGQFQAHY